MAHTTDPSPTPVPAPELQMGEFEALDTSDRAHAMAHRLRQDGRAPRPVRARKRGPAAPGTSLRRQPGEMDMATF